MGAPIMAATFKTPAARLGAQIFVLGMVDMLRQNQGLPWDEFVSISAILFERHNLMPDTPVEQFIEVIGSRVSDSNEFALLMKDGAQSISMFVGEKDANAPIDILRAAKYAENNELSLQLP